MPPALGSAPRTMANDQQPRKRARVKAPALGAEAGASVRGPPQAGNEAMAGGATASTASKGARGGGPERGGDAAATPAAAVAPVRAATNGVDTAAVGRQSPATQRPGAVATSQAAAASTAAASRATAPGASAASQAAASVAAAPRVSLGTTGGAAPDAAAVAPPSQAAPPSNNATSMTGAIGAGDAAAPAPAFASGEKSGQAFLRLASNCEPTMKINQLIYLNKDELLIGRLPSCDVVLESSRVPQMISRVHGRLTRRRPEATTADPHACTERETWVLHDNRSLNGVLVNGTKVGQEGRELHTGDVILFGRILSPPEFEFVFESAPVEVASKTPTVPGQDLEELFGDHRRRIEELQRELEAEREQKKAELEAKRQEQASAASASGPNLADLHSELVCSVCQDWLVHAATVECSHTFCFACIDTWLHQRKFECPVCRTEVTREPVRTRAVDAIVQKSVDRLAPEAKQEYASRMSKAEEAMEKRNRAHSDLEKSVNEALKNGKAFFHIDSNWTKRERERFHKGVKDYAGATRATYCKLTGLTEQWVHSADDSKLNQALHNLSLQTFAGKPAPDIRQRLLMFLKYG
mmetsp:Transcript_81682/g.227436  ORF Transcript_81682/g.227436 Transcript_81682/m.227436 type:complete len:583 (-) Transcript_81682:68-1816(-)